MNKDKSHLYGLIFAGGGGTRLWPLSRNSKPKQFLKLFSNKTLLRQAFERIAAVIPPSHIFVITMQEYKKQVRRELNELSPEQIIVEPERKNTAAAVLLGTLSIYMHDKKAVVVNVWSDHHIENPDQYKDAVVSAFRTATEGNWLVATGVEPTFPHTGLGYIQYSKSLLSNNFQAFHVEKFIEKPDFKKAEDLLDRGNVLWNVGLYVWRAKTILDAFEKYAGDYYGHLETLKQGLSQKNMRKIQNVYKKLQELPIEKAVVEKAEKLAVIKAEFDWSDIGDFQVLWERTINGSIDGNSLLGKGRDKIISLNTQGVLVLSNSKQLVALYGLRNIAVVVTQDVVLVIPRDEAQKVKDIVAVLQKKKHKKFL